MPTNRLLLLLATLCFAILFVFGLFNGFDVRDLGWLGLALFSGSFLV